MSMQHVQEEDKTTSATVKFPCNKYPLIKGAHTTDLISKNHIHRVSSELK